MLDLLTLIKECAPIIAPQTMQAIVMTESGGNPFVIGNNSTKKTIYAGNREEAIRIANQLLSAGNSVDLGLAQINNMNLKSLNLSVENVFDPCINLTAAQTVLSWGYKQATKKYSTEKMALLGAISAYNTGSIELGFTNGYVAKVLANTNVKTDSLKIPAVRRTSPASGKSESIVSNENKVTPYSSPLTAKTEDPGESEKHSLNPPENASAATEKAPVDPKNSPLDVSATSD